MGEQRYIAIIASHHVLTKYSVSRTVAAQIVAFTVSIRHYAYHLQ